MSLSWAQVLMLPLDVANSRGSGGDLRMDIFWQAIYIALGVMVLFVIPSLIYYDEADSDWTFVFILLI
jgi:hypothetical protein